MSEPLITREDDDDARMDLKIFQEIEQEIYKEFGERIYSSKGPLLANNESVDIDEQPQEGSRALSQGDTVTIQTLEGVNIQGHIDLPTMTSFVMEDQEVEKEEEQVVDEMGKSLKK